MLLICIIGAIIALQFSDAIASYGVLSNDITRANSILQWFAGKLGIATTLITIKVVIVAFFVALYFFTKLPWEVYLLALAYYLYSSGKGLILWRSIVNSKSTEPVPPVAVDPEPVPADPSKVDTPPAPSASQ